MTPKRTMPSKSTMPDDAQQSRLTRKKNDTQRNSKRFQNNVNKRFQNNEANNANQIRAEDLKIRKSRVSFIREIKLTHSKDGRH